MDYFRRLYKAVYSILFYLKCRLIFSKLDKTVRNGKHVNHSTAWAVQYLKIFPINAIFIETKKKQEIVYISNSYIVEKESNIVEFCILNTESFISRLTITL